MQPKRLYRSRTNTMLGGVASGLAEYFSLDPLVVRIIFVLMALLGGGGVIIYLALWIFLPQDPDFTYQTYNTSTMENEPQFTQTGGNGQQEPWRDPMRNPRQGNLIGGLILITIGVLFLLDRFTEVNFGDLWPVILIVAGLAVLTGSFGKSKNS